jgi:ubiquinone/menaquinone biosynthesis C-methylase UbiE
MASTMEVSSARKWGWAAEQARYRARHTGLAVGFGVTLHLLYRTLMPDTRRPPEPEVGRELIRRFRELLDVDIANVESGYYPRELLFQFPLLRYLAQAPAQVVDLPRVAMRRRENRWRDLPTDVKLDRFPHYYRRNFHWQTDGWLSRRSARVYDFEVELLFGGTADIMRRMALPPLVDALRNHPAPRILDVGCGTGRFLLQLAAALPSARLFGLDLSAFYIKEATETLADVADVSLLVENGESMPFRDGAFDAVSSVFLFHELPRATRRDVLREMARVAGPGGTVVVCDSAQAVESAALLPALEGFARTYHEPFYMDYVRDPLEDLFREVGLEVVATQPFSVSKVVTGRVPSSPDSH